MNLLLTFSNDEREIWIESRINTYLNELQGWMINSPAAFNLFFSFKIPLLLPNNFNDNLLAFGSSIVQSLFWIKLGFMANVPSSLSFLRNGVPSKENFCKVCPVESITSLSDSKSFASLSVGAAVTNISGLSDCLPWNARSLGLVSVGWCGTFDGATRLLCSDFPIGVIRSEGRTWLWFPLLFAMSVRCMMESQTTSQYHDVLITWRSSYMNRCDGRSKCLCQWLLYTRNTNKALRCRFVCNVTMKIL